MKITVTIEDSKVSEFEAAAAKALNKNLSVKMLIKDTLMNIYETGKRLEAREHTKPLIDIDIVEVA